MKDIKTILEWSINVNNKYGGWKVLMWLGIIFIPSFFLSWIWGFILGIGLVWLFFSARKIY